jgi:hypothetical protein
MRPLIRWGLLVSEVDCQWFFFGVDSSEAEPNHLNNTSHLLTDQVRLTEPFGPESSGMATSNSVKSST